MRKIWEDEERDGCQRCKARRPATAMQDKDAGADSGDCNKEENEEEMR